jgi:hypothetical protein
VPYSSSAVGLVIFGKVLRRLIWGGFDGVGTTAGIVRTLVAIIAVILIAAGPRIAQAAPAGESVVIQSYGSVDVSQLPPATSNMGTWKGAPRKFPDSNALAQLKQSYKPTKSSKPGPRPTKTATPTPTATVAGPTPTATATPTPTAVPGGMPPPSASFSGLGFLDSGGWVPPDTTVAAGLGSNTVTPQLVEAVNLEMRVTDKSGNLIKQVTLASLFNTSAQLSDPRVLYDGGHWYIAAITVPPSGQSTGSWVLAVSDGEDATGSYVLYAYVTSGSFPDFPKMGVNENKVVLTGDSFTGNTFNGTEYLVLNKTQLITCASGNTSPCSANAWYYPPDEGAFAIEPAQHLPITTNTSPANDNLYMAAVPYNSATSVTVWAVSGVPTGGLAPAQSELTLNINQMNSPPDAAQCNTSKTVVTNDNALLNAVFRDGSPTGYLWLSGSDACMPPGDSTTRSCARFIEVAINNDTLSANTVSIAQDFDVAQAGFYYYYPAATFSSNGDMAAVFSGSSSSVCPGVYAVEQFAGSPPTLSTVEQIHGGAAQYIQANRWGDYSGIGLDPADNETIWIAAEYASVYSCAPFTCSDWGTWIANVPAP